MTWRDNCGADYGTYAWYKDHCHELADAEWQAHEQKRVDYCGPDTNVFWMTDDIETELGKPFEDVWLAWSARHWRGLVRALQSGDRKQAAKRALDLMGWLFLLLAKFKPKDKEKTGNIKLKNLNPSFFCIKDGRYDRLEFDCPACGEHRISIPLTGKIKWKMDGHNFTDIILSPSISHDNGSGCKTHFFIKNGEIEHV